MVSRIYWPKTGLQGQSGQAVGWRVEDIAVVVGIVDESLVEQVCSELGLSALGTICGASDEQPHDHLVTLECGQPVPRPGVSIVLFDPPDPVRLRYFTAMTGPAVAGTSQPAALDIQDAYGMGGTSKLAGVERAIPLLNNMKMAQRRLALLRGRAGIPAIGFPAMPSLVKEVVSMLVSPVALLLRLVVWIANITLCGHRVQKHSSTLCQLALRASQLLNAPSDFRRTLHDPEVGLDVRSQRYVRFWNTVWLILNDLVLGFCAKELMSIAAPQLSSWLPLLFQRHLVEDIIKALAWLDDWPVGLKLNTPLSRFFRTAFTMLISTWGTFALPLLASHGPVMVRLLSLTGHGGFTLFVSVSRDTIALLSAHLRLSHAVTLSLVRWQLDSLGGLWNLFRGKKWNILRQRTDTYAYDVDQLFLGTLLFTVSAFLFPTVLAYAALFGMVCSGLWAIDKILDMATQALNAFPLFEVLLRLKEPSRLPDGIVFRFQARGVQSVLEMKILVVDIATA